MKRLLTTASLILAMSTIGLLLSSAPASPTPTINDELPEGIAFYGVLQDGLDVARATNRPILLLSAAPQCAGVPGMW